VPRYRDNVDRRINERERADPDHDDVPDVYEAEAREQGS
jgi:hypothetical protein